MLKRSTLLGVSVITLLAISAIPTSSVAADLDPPLPPIRPAVLDWSGGYIGGVLGALCIDAFYVPTPGSDPTFAGCGFAGGVTGGYNHQFGNFLVGVEADTMWGQKVAHNPAPEDTEFHVEWITTVRGRIGWLATDETMFYATGGPAWLEGRFDGLVGAVSQPASDTQTHFGFVVGGGIEHAITDSIHARVEYLYGEFDNKTYDHTVAACPALTCTSVLHLDEVHIMRAGVTWNFGYGPVL